MLKNPSVVRYEWLYDISAYDADSDTRRTFYLALLCILDDGTATIYVENKSYAFPSEEEAEIWLTSEEFAPIEFLTEPHEVKVIAPTALPL